MGAVQMVGAAGLVFVALALAVFFPWAMHGRLSRPETLRELYLFSRPGSVVTGLLLGILALVLAASAFALAAIQYPVFWSIVAMLCGVLLAGGELLVRYVRFDRVAAIEEQTDEPG